MFVIVCWKKDNLTSCQIAKGFDEKGNDIGALLFDSYIKAENHCAQIAEGWKYTIVEIN